MNSCELLAEIGVKVNGELPEITGLAIHAGAVRSGDAFAAMKGAARDGADYVAEAVQNGAVLILAEREIVADVPVVVVPNLRRQVSRLAARLYPSDQVMKLAVTGTNGKTSTVYYVQQLLNRLGILAASLGTIGVDSIRGHIEGHMTTPDAITLNKTLHDLQKQGIRVVALEASSHGLDQGRLDGLMFRAGAFTNLTQDHLDYHKTMAAYLDAKSKLFSDYVAADGLAVLNADDSAFTHLADMARGRGLRVISYGRQGADFRLISQTPTEYGQSVVFEAGGRRYETNLAIVGDFQVMNLFAAMGLCLGAGVAIEQIIPLLPELQAPSGRIEQMGTLPNGARVFVDYAHTPDAVERVLISLRAHTKGKLVCVIGCGGNRDTGKRPLMGAAADRLADRVYITDDNPRFENPAAIRTAIREACPNAEEYDNREEAIYRAVKSLEPQDVLVIAGKGHEAGQTINGITYAMDDRVEARLAIMSRTTPALWTAEELKLALSVKVPERIQAYGVSIDTRTLKLGDLFLAMSGENSDGHAFVKRAVELGAAACVVTHLVAEVPAEKQIVVADVMNALESLARFSRMRSSATFIGITGSSGKTTTKEMLKAILSAQGQTQATQGNLNNQIGVPLTLARVGAGTRYAVIEMGMNHSGELYHLSDMVRPDITIITSIGLAHRAFFKTEADVAKAKSEIFEFQNRQGVAVLNKADDFYDFLKQAAAAQGIARQVSFGADKTADVALVSAVSTGDKTTVDFMTQGRTYQMTLGFVGTHYVSDALGALAVVLAAGGDLEQAIKTLETQSPAAGRGAVSSVIFAGHHINLIDDAYNANPSSMAASVRALGLRRGGRKIVVLGDMLELGDLGPKLHADMAPVLNKAGVDRVYLAGELMTHLWADVPADKQGAHTRTPEELLPILARDLQDGDFVLVKASHGAGLYRLIQMMKGNK